MVLDPALGGDYLTTWASDVVVTVTALPVVGDQDPAVGDMVRLAEADSVSAVLIRADKGDETLACLRPSTGPAWRQPERHGLMTSSSRCDDQQRAVTTKFPGSRRLR